MIGRIAAKGLLAAVLVASASTAEAGQEEEQAAIQKVLDGLGQVLDLNRSPTRQRWNYAKNGGDEPVLPPGGPPQLTHDQRGTSWLSRVMSNGFANCFEYSVLAMHLLQKKAAANEGLFGKVYEAALHPGDHLFTIAVSADGQRAYIVDAWADGAFRVTTPAAIEQDENCQENCLYQSLFLGNQVPDTSRQQYVYPNSNIESQENRFSRFTRTWGKSVVGALQEKFAFFDEQELQRL